MSRGTAVNADFEMEHLLPRPNEMDFNAANLAVTWKKWKQTMMLYLSAVMNDRSEEERYSTILFVIGEGGREIFAMWIWDKVQDGNDTDVNKITVEVILQKYEEYCMPKRNFVVERWRSFLRS